MKNFFSVLVVSALFAFSAMAGDGKTAALNLNVTGMHCGGCASKVKAALIGIDGVQEVSNVSAETKSASLSYDPAKVTEEQIVEALVEKTGYTVSVNKAGAKASCCKGEGKTCSAADKAACAKSKGKCSKATTE